MMTTSNSDILASTKLFKCSDFIKLHKCQQCVFFSNEKIKTLKHKCKSENLSEVRFNLGKKCGAKCASTILSSVCEHRKRYLTKNKVKGETLKRNISKNWKCNNLQTQKKFECNLCFYQTHFNFLLINHKIRKHTIKFGKTFTCDQCIFQTYRKNSLKIHKTLYHTTKNYVCQICKYQSKFHHCLQIHMKLKHSKAAELYKCDKCSFACTTINGLNTHKNKNHALHESAKQFLCEVCLFQTHRKRHLKTHILRKHTPENLIQWFDCAICNHRSKSRSDLINHIASRHSQGEKKYKCTECNFQTHTERNLRYHKTSIHVRNEVFKCADCKFKTHAKKLLRIHKMKNHVSYDLIKWYECEYNNCDYRSKDRSNFKQHMIIKHSAKEKKFKCDLCPFETHVNCNLKTHKMSRHTPDELIKWSTCEKCSYKTKFGGLLKKHIQKKHS